MTGLLLLNLLVYGLALWLGLYLIARDPRSARLRYTGLGLVVYALGLALDRFIDFNPQLALLRPPLLFLPALLWFGAAVDLLPEDAPLRIRLKRPLAPGLLLLVVLLFVLGLRDLAALYPLLVVALLLPPLWFVWRAYRAARSKRTFGILLVVGIFFGLSNGLLFLPWFVSSEVTILLIGLDLALLGIVIAVLDAFDEGEAFLPDFLRSFAVALLMGLVFGGQVVLAISILGVSLPLLALLFTSVTLAIAAQVFADSIQTAVDRLVFARFPRLRQVRADLRAAASAAPRLNPALDLTVLDEAEFARLTRRALSQMGNLGKLAASPLTRLPLIEARLAERGGPDNTLERAAELKALLTESILRLKPRDRGDFGTSDEWRHYNALYYPYVIGLKPYSQMNHFDALDADTRAVLEWFRQSIPERTLHNWQNAAARLIAQALRETGSGWQ